MDWMSMLMNARIRDIGGGVLGDVLGVHIVAGKMSITVDNDVEDEEGPEDPDEEELDPTEEIPKPTPLRAVAGGPLNA